MVRKLVKLLHSIWHHLIGYFLHYLAILSIALIVSWFKSFRDQSPGIRYYLQTAIEWVTPLTIATLAVGIVSIFLNARKLHLQNSKLKDIQEIMGNFGIRTFSSHSTVTEKAQDWSMIADDVRLASSHESPLWLLGATGKNTFGATDSPLHKAICEYRGAISILLLYPQSNGFKYRIKQLRANQERYMDEILDSLQFCRESKINGVNIQVKLYEGMPIWKLLIMPQTIWLQHYGKTGHVDNSPLYGFSLVHNKPTLLEGYRSVFEKRWNHDDSKVVDLETFDRSNWPPK